MFSPASSISPDYFPTYIASGRGIARVAGTPAFLNPPRRSPPQNQNQNPRGRVQVPPTERSIVDEFIRPMHATWALLLRYLRGGTGRVRVDEAAVSGGGNGERAGEPVEALRVSVLIAMPTQAPRSSFKSVNGIVDELDGRLFGEYALGVLDVPWHVSEGK